MDNTHISSAESRVDDETGLRTVRFLVRGVRDWPTALNPNYTLLHSPVDAFRGGAEAVKLPPRYEYNYSSSVRMYTCESVVNSDGGALDFSNGKILLRKYKKIIEFPFPGRVDMTLDKGPVMSASVTYSVPAEISLYLLDESLAQQEPALPYQVRSWCSYGASYVPEETNIPQSEGGTGRGYLVGDVWAGVNTTYKGAPVKTVVAWGNSAPTHNGFLNAISEGKVVERATFAAFSDAYGKPYYFMRETFVQFSPDEIQV